MVRPRTTRDYNRRGGGGEDGARPNELGSLNSQVNSETGIVTTTVTETRAEEHKLGEFTRLTRDIVVRSGTLNELESTVQSLGLALGAGHPDFPLITMTDLSYDENVETGRGSDVTVYSATIKAVYELKQDDNPEKPKPGDNNPLSVPDRYIFETSGQPIAALWYYDNNNTLQPMANSAGDPIKGLQVDEAIQQIIIRRNQPTFPFLLAAAVTNCTNDANWYGFPAGTVKCQGVRGESKQEIVGEVNVWYYEVEVRLLYRQSGWDLYVPDVGYNYLDNNGDKRRCWVLAPGEDGEPDTKVASADPVALNGIGAMQPAGVAPAILTRRIYPRISFSSYFS